MLMEELKKKLGTSMIMITHDLGVVAETCDKVAVMYAGEIVEYGSLKDIFSGEKHHPYTVGLFQAIPNLDVKTDRLQPVSYTHLLIMEQVKRGDIPILVACDTAVQMLRFLDVVKPYPDMKVIFTLSYQADRIADQLKERNAAVILGDSSRSSLHCHYQMNYGQLRKMADDGLPFGLTLLGPDMSWGRETVFWNVSRLLQGEEEMCIRDRVL